MKRKSSFAERTLELFNQTKHYFDDVIAKDKDEEDE